MTTLLLRTKLYHPKMRPNAILRQGLIRTLNAGVNKKLTLISAPAGFGKTTVVTEWLSQEDRSFTWLSLDEDDNDINRFFTYIAAAVQQIDGVGQSIQRILQSGQSVPEKVMATALINDCTSVSAPFVLVFDDFHVIREMDVFEVVTFLLDNMPPQMHLVITSRTDPLLPLSRLRARGQLTELRTDDLRFSAEETANFLQQVMGLTISVERAKALGTRTEGWVAGLQMAALSIHRLKSESEIADFITDFSGSNRYIFDYLTDEVLQQQSPEIQAFLLQTSLLDRLSASLCTTVTDVPNSQTILEQLESDNLFIFSLDDKREWYRYHHLFAELLRHRLQSRYPEKIPIIYQHASQWYALEGDVEIAIHYALAGNDSVAAGRLLDQEALDFVKRSEVLKLLKLVERLPIDVNKQFLRLCLAQSWSYIFTGKLDLAETSANWAASLLQADIELPEAFPLPLAEAHQAAIRAYIAKRRGELQEAISFSTTALTKLEALSDKMARSLWGTILINLGQTQVDLNELIDAEQSYRQAIALSQESGRIFGVMAACSNLMVLLRRRGQLVNAKEVGLHGLNWLEAHQQGREQNYPAEGEIRRELTIIFYEQNNLQEARTHAERVITLYRYANPMGEANGQHLLFLVMLAEGDLASAIQIHKEIESRINQFPPIFRHFHSILRGERLIRLVHAEPDVPEWLDSLIQWQAHTKERLLTTNPSVATSDESVLLVHAKVLSKLHQFETAREILNQIAERAESTAYFGDIIAYRVQQALVSYQLGERQTAISQLNQAIQQGAKNQYLRTFLDEAEALRPVLPLLPQTLYRDQLIELVGLKRPQAPKKMSRMPAGVIEPLSKRELDVLTLLATHLSGPEIASQLHISPNTLKTHTRNIYGKLGVNSRNEAVISAQNAGLL